MNRKPLIIGGVVAAAAAVLALALWVLWPQADTGIEAAPDIAVPSSAPSATPTGAPAGAGEGDLDRDLDRDFPTGPVEDAGFTEDFVREWLDFDSAEDSTERLARLEPYVSAGSDILTRVPVAAGGGSVDMTTTESLTTIGVGPNSSWAVSEANGDQTYAVTVNWTTRVRLSDRQSQVTGPFAQVIFVTVASGENPVVVKVKESNPL